MDDTRPAAGPRREYRFPSTVRHSLSNGLRVVVAPLPRLPLVTVLALVDAGAANDGSTTQGTALLTARALGEGTVRLDGAELAEEFEVLGSGLDTGSEWDETIASLTVTPPRLDAAVTLLAEVLTTPRFSERDILRRKADRLAELMQQQVEPRGLADDRFHEYLYLPGSRYGVPEGGNVSTVRQIEAATVRAFHAERYTPWATTLIFVGDVEPDLAVQLAGRAFGGWAGARKSVMSVDDRSRSGGARVHAVHRPGASQTELRVGHRGLPRAHPDYFPVVVMNALLGGLFSSRINLNLRERHAFTYGANSAFDWRRSAGPFVVATAVKTDVTAAAVREILTEIDHMRSQTVTAGEISLATDYLDGVFPIRYETTLSLAHAIAVAEVHALGEDYYTRYRERIRAVTAREVNRVAEKHLHPADTIVVAVGDVSAIQRPLEALGLGPTEIHEGEAAP